MKKTWVVLAPDKSTRIKVAAYSKKQAQLKAFFKWVKGQGLTFKQINTMRGPWMRTSKVL